MENNVCTVKSKSRHRIKYRIWDTDANRNHEQIRKVYYRHSHAILLMFDLTRRETFNALDFWIKSILSMFQDKARPLIYMIGNKIPSQETRV